MQISLPSPLFTYFEEPAWYPGGVGDAVPRASIAVDPEGMEAIEHGQAVGHIAEPEAVSHCELAPMVE